MKTYLKGADVLAGDGIMDMIPMLSAFSGGSKKDSSGDAVKKAIEQEREKQAAAKAQATTKILLITLISLVGLGGVVATVAVLAKK